MSLLHVCRDLGRVAKVLFSLIKCKRTPNAATTGIPGVSLLSQNTPREQEQLGDNQDLSF